MSPVEILQDFIREKEKELNQLRLGLAALQTALSQTSSLPPVQSEPAQAPLPAASPVTVAEAPSIPKPQYTGPRCGACGNKMYQTHRTMPSGAVVNLLKCNDSACGNEAYQ